MKERARAAKRRADALVHSTKRGPSPPSMAFIFRYMTGTCEGAVPQKLQRLPPVAEEVVCGGKQAGFAFDLSLVLLSFEHDSLVETSHLTYQQLLPCPTPIMLSVNYSTAQYD